MKLKKLLLSLCMAMSFVVAFAFAGCSDCITDDPNSSDKPTTSIDPDDEWTDNH